VGVALARDPAVRGVFFGVIRLARRDETQAAMLILHETGPDALPRPQRIPLLIPTATAVDAVLPAESYSFGVNEPLLRAVAGAGGGKFNPAPQTPLLAGMRPPPPGVPLWPPLFAAAAVAYVLAVAVRRLEP
jgi:hypothetical protein